MLGTWKFGMKGQRLFKNSQAPRQARDKVHARSLRHAGHEVIFKETE
jgi:hypothetical protein